MICVSPQTARTVLAMIGTDFSMEDAMRLLFPQESERMYDAGRWPFGPPSDTRETRLERWINRC
jgi:hypothetical protein